MNLLAQTTQPIVIQCTHQWSGSDYFVWFVGLGLVFFLAISAIGVAFGTSGVNRPNVD